MADKDKPVYTHIPVYIHVSKEYEPCDHEWPDELEDISQCLKCGISFIRYIFMEAP